MKKFSKILEDIEYDEVKDPNRFDDVVEELKKMISETIHSDNQEVISKFIDSVIKNPDENQIEGLINNDDIYAFYLKWRNETDDILSENKFYDNIPSEKNIFSLYDYVISGTETAINYFIKKIK